jgi:hypothetical protein
MKSKEVRPRGCGSSKEGIMEAGVTRKEREMRNGGNIFEQKRDWKNEVRGGNIFTVSLILVDYLLLTILFASLFF